MYAKAHQKRASGRSSGQMTILITLIFLTLFVLFAFVMNVGILISEKINLQNAADAGAYAGASMQARVLNNIAFLNYRMRQEWKEFSFHHWVTFQRSAENHPVNWFRPTPNSLRNMDESYTGDPPGAPIIPCICIGGSHYRGRKSNFCQKSCAISPALGTGSSSFAGVASVQSVFTSPLVTAMTNSVEDLRKIIKTEWITLNDETKEMAEEKYYKKYSQRTDALYKKIQAYVDYFNQIGRVSDPSTADDPISKTVFETIRRNLSFGNLENLQVLVLNPDKDPPWIKLDEPSPGKPYIEASLLIYYARLDTVGAELKRTITPKPERKTMKIGVAKDQNTVTYYALRLLSKPNLIYLPEHWEPILVAYAAAKPFGSRIGPHFSKDSSTPPKDRLFDRHMMLSNQSGDLLPPNFSFKDGDPWGMASAGQMDLFRRYYVSGQAEESEYPTADTSNSNYYSLLSVRAPNFFESMRYSIFTDPAVHAIGNGDINPLETFRYPDAMDRSTFPPLFDPDTGIQRASLFNIGAPTFNATDRDGVANDMTLDTETLKTDTGQKAARANMMQTRTAWCNDVEFENDWGRVGYSVKLINMNQLVSITFGGLPLENLPAGDPNFEGATSGRNIWH